MDEMQLLRELGDGTPLASAQELAPARAQLIAGTRKRSKNKLAWYGGAVVGLAAAIFAVFALIPPSQDGGGPVPSANADPVKVLRLASAAALKAPHVVPRPDQFVYHKYQNSDGSTREDWLSVDGTRNGLIRQGGEDMPTGGCAGGEAPVIKGNGPATGKVEICEPHPAYRPDMPADADAMLVWLNKNHSGKEGDINAMGKDILELMSSYLKPESRAALFEATTRIKGLKVVENAKDAAGRPGLRIEWTAANKNSGEFVIDANTYAYLGNSNYDALLKMAIVDNVGQRP